MKPRAERDMSACEVFPFAAIVGQEDLKTALLVCAVDPGLGGVLIRGDKGTAKSTAARALAEVLPAIQRVDGCSFNCMPHAATEHCARCGEDDAVARPSPVPFVTLPLGATEDRVVGTLDLQRALQGAQRVFQPGLLAAAHRGILYLDEVNLLPDHLVDVLLDAAAMGVNTVQREGLSIVHPARFTLIGTMNPEEGDLRPQLLDRFGLMVEALAPQDPRVRSEVVRRRIAFETDRDGFRTAWASEQEALRARIAGAQERLPQVHLRDELLDLIGRLCCELGAASLRADLAMHKAARALAALDGRLQVTQDDVRGAAQLALPHRRRHKPFEQPGLDRERLDELMGDATAPSAPRADGDSEPNPETRADACGFPEAADGDAGEEPQAFGVAGSDGVRRIEVVASRANPAVGRRSESPGAARGFVVRSVPDPDPASLAVGATLRSAALRGPRGTGEASAGKPDAPIQVTRADLHRQVRVGKNANLIFFLVDSSGSMAAQQRMEAVKGAVHALLTDAYQCRDEVAVIAFGGSRAQLLVAPTRSVDLAQQGLRELPTGGRTPLPHALQLSLECLAKARASGAPPLLVLLSDGKANVPLTEGADPWHESLALAARLAERGVPALVLDTETGYLRLGRARQLAQTLGAECIRLEDLSAENLTLAIRKRRS